MHQPPHHSTMAGQQHSCFVLCMNIINTITQLLLGAISISAIMFANQIRMSNHIRQHIYLCVIGYIILMAQAILSISPFGWSGSLKYLERKNLHWIMQVIGAIFAIIGSIIAIAGTNSHFQTTHAIFGIISLIFTIVSLCWGAGNLYAHNINMNPNIIRICHSTLGCITIICAFLSLICAFNEWWFRSSRGTDNANLMISLTVAALVGTLLPASTNLIRRIH